MVVEDIVDRHAKILGEVGLLTALDLDREPSRLEAVPPRHVLATGRKARLATYHLGDLPRRAIFDIDHVGVRVASIPGNELAVLEVAGPERD